MQKEHLNWNVSTSCECQACLIQTDKINKSVHECQVINEKAEKKNFLQTMTHHQL
jgi:hypothetical protein